MVERLCKLDKDLRLTDRKCFKFFIQIKGGLDAIEKL